MSGLPGVPGRPQPATAQSPETGAAKRSGSSTAAPFDPLRLCVYTTVALLTWAFGPVAVLVFAALGLLGYWRAHQAGLTRTKCYLRDVRLVLLYLGLAAVGAVIAIGVRVWHWLG